MSPKTKHESRRTKTKGRGAGNGFDLGMINTATTVKEDGEAKIYSGKGVLSIQRYFNKERVKLQRQLSEN
ncbi:MAG: transposase [Methanophagales archaeon]|nr:transposase [Methanophagales archaeon]